MKTIATSVTTTIITVRRIALARTTLIRSGLDFCFMAPFPTCRDMEDASGQV